MRKQQFHNLSLLIFAGLICSSAARATILYNAPPNQSGASDMNQFAEADNFVVAAPINLTGIRFWTAQSSASDYAGSTFTALLSDNSGVPGSVLASGNPVLVGSPTGNTVFGLNEFVYQFAVNTILSPGVYWLVLHNGPIGTIPSTTFYWEWAADTGDSQSRDLGPPVQPWATNSSELAFELQGTLVPAPEPASVLLMGGGLLAAWMARRKLGSRA